MTPYKNFVFFSGSIKRWELLEGHLSNSSGQRTLKRLCPMRWASRNYAIESLRFRYVDVLQALSKIILLSKNPDECAEAMGLKKAMEKFKFVLMTVIQGKILETVNVASCALQDKNMDIMLASKLLGNVLDTLTKLRGYMPEQKHWRNHGALGLHLLTSARGALKRTLMNRAKTSVCKTPKSTLGCQFFVQQSTHVQGN